MTRELFESTFLELYEQMVYYTEKRVPHEGRDIVHQAFANILDNATYVNGPSQHVKRWVFFKISREIARALHRKTIREAVEKEGARRLYNL